MNIRRNSLLAWSELTLVSLCHVNPSALVGFCARNSVILPTSPERVESTSGRKRSKLPPSGSHLRSGMWLAPPLFLERPGSLWALKPSWVVQMLTWSFLRVDVLGSFFLGPDGVWSLHGKFWTAWLLPKSLWSIQLSVGHVNSSIFSARGFVGDSRRGKGGGFQNWQFSIKSVALVNFFDTNNMLCVGTRCLTKTKTYGVRFLTQSYSVSTQNYVGWLVKWTLYAVCWFLEKEETICHIFSPPSLSPVWGCFQVFPRSFPTKGSFVIRHFHFEASCMEVESDEAMSYVTCCQLSC